MMNKKSLPMLLLCLAGTTFVGCGGGGAEELTTVAVKGTVTFNGESKTSGQVTFTPVREGKDEERPTVIGTIGSDGTFTLTTYEEGDGAAPGDYTVELGGGGGGGASSVESADMMAMMGGGSGLGEPIEVTIPAGGSESLKLEFTGSEKKAVTGPQL